MHKKVILIDLDGVLNTYTGDFDKDFIPEIIGNIIPKTYEKIITTVITEVKIAYSGLYCFIVTVNTAPTIPITTTETIFISYNPKTLLTVSNKSLI